MAHVSLGNIIYVDFICYLESSKERKGKNMLKKKSLFILKLIYVQKCYKNLTKQSCKNRYKL